MITKPDEIKHGMWELVVPGHEWSPGRWRCSECGEETDDGYLERCPKCGAVMDEYYDDEDDCFEPGRPVIDIFTLNP